MIIMTVAHHGCQAFKCLPKKINKLIKCCKFNSCLIRFDGADKRYVSTMYKKCAIYFPENNRG